MLQFKRRVQFTKEEENMMWQFFINKIQNRDIDAKKLDNKIWIQYKKNLENKKIPCEHTQITIAKHFVRHMLPKLAQSQLTNDEINEILKCCELKFLRDDRQALKNLEERLNCKLKLDALNHVHRLNSTMVKPKNFKNNSKVITDLNKNKSFNLSQPCATLQRRNTLSTVKNITTVPLPINLELIDSNLQNNKSDDSNKLIETCSTKNLNNNQKKHMSTSAETVVDEIVVNNNEILNQNTIEDSKSNLLSEELQAELLYYHTLINMHEVNGGIEQCDVMAMKELVMLRGKLILQKVMPIEQLFEKIPTKFQENLQNFYDFLKWCVSDETHFFE